MLDGGFDQASGLRRLFSRRTLRVLPLASSHGARGSAAFVVNLAAALARSGCRPLVIDAHPDAVATSLGMTPRFELADLLERQHPFGSVALRTAEGFSVLPAARGLAVVAADPDAGEALFSAFAALRDGYDIALVHAPVETLGALLRYRSVETALLCGPDDNDLTSTYASLKSMVTDHGLMRFRVVFDRAGAPAVTAQRHRRLAAAANRYLSAAVEYGGAIASEQELDTARRAKASVFAVCAQGRAARSFERIASAARNWQLPEFEPGGFTIH